MKSSGIGGQAVIEGVMMKNDNYYAVAVRTPEDEIKVEKKEYHSISEKNSFFKLPFVRGVVAFVDSMKLGMDTLTYSASFYEEEEVETGKLEKAVSGIFKEKAEAVLTGLTVILAVVLAVGIFMLLPWGLTELLGDVIKNPMAQVAVEGAIRLVIFVLYVFAISLMSDIKRVYMYHGAEHKTINCVENGLELTVENVRKQSKEHKRCGTSFMLYVVVISIFFFMFIRVETAILRLVLRVLLVPVVAGVAYEFIRLAGNSDNIVVHVLSRPGLWMQGLTTKEPDDKMIEVAIKSVEAVFDWKAFIEENRSENVKASKKGKSSVITTKVSDEENDKSPETEQTAAEVKRPTVAVAKRADGAVRRTAYFHEPEKKEIAEQEEQAGEETILENRSAEPVRPVATLKKAQGVRRPMQAIEEVRRNQILVDAEEEEEDEILSALDKFFQ